MKRFSIPPREERERHSHTMSAYKSACKVFYVFAGPADYLTGMYDEQIRYVMQNGVKQTTTYSGSTYGTLPTNINVTWIDEEGRFYEVSKTVVDAPTQ